MESNWTEEKSIENICFTAISHAYVILQPCDKWEDESINRKFLFNTHPQNSWEDENVPISAFPQFS